MADQDIYVDQGQQPVMITAGDDISLPLHLEVRATKLAPDGTVVIEKFDFSLLPGDDIVVAIPTNDGNPQGAQVSFSGGGVTIVDAERGEIMAAFPGTMTQIFQRFQQTGPGTFKARVIRGGNRSTFVFAGLLVVKDDDFNPFM
jgi:hypothetical protein